MKVSKEIGNAIYRLAHLHDLQGADREMLRGLKQSYPIALQMERVCEAAAIAQTYLRGAVKPYEYENLCDEVRKFQQLMGADDE